MSDLSERVSQPPADEAVYPLQNPAAASLMPAQANAGRGPVEPLKDFLREQELAYLNRALAQTGGDKEKAAGLVQAFRDYLAQHQTEIDALQILYSRPYQQRLTGSDPDSDPLRFKVTSLPTNGKLYDGTGTAGHLIVVPLALAHAQEPRAARGRDE